MLYCIKTNMELIILAQDYINWQWRNIYSGEIIDKSQSIINPAMECLIHGDAVDDMGKILTPSSIRTEKNIPCILDFKGSTYGRVKDKLLYRCIPDDKTIPQFIVPYDPKNIGFDKTKTNKYVLIQFKEWIKGKKHPTGVLTNMLGNADSYDAYAEYQLYCKKLVQSLKELAKQTQFLKDKTNIIDEIYSSYHNIENRTHLNIISIDPENCKDIDDAIGIVRHATHITISVYIANVSLILDYFNLWQHITKKCSTIYLPDKKIPMLPPILSDNICSLLEDQLRFAFALDINIPLHEHNRDTLQSCSIVHCFKPVLIKVSKNYVYEEPELMKNDDYQELLKITQILDKTVKDSHDLVEYFMVYMNWLSALELVEYNCGILRSATIKSDNMKSDNMKSANIEDIKKHHSLPEDVQKFITHFKHASGQYCNIHNRAPHVFIGYDVYTHITSPIRRIVDIVNMTLLQDKLGFIKYKTNTADGSVDALQFCNTWQNKVEFINSYTKNVKKIQNRCNLLALYIKTKDNTIRYQGYIFDRRENETINKKNKRKYSYSVYVPDYKMVSNITTDELIEEYSNRQFTMHLFMDGACLKEKIRLQLC